MNAPFDAEKFKAATREQWDKHAKGWNDHSMQIGDWLRESTEAMLAMADVGAGARVLDVAAGGPAARGPESHESAFRRLGRVYGLAITEMAGKYWLHIDAGLPIFVLAMRKIWEQDNHTTGEALGGKRPVGDK